MWVNSSVKPSGEPLSSTPIIDFVIALPNLVCCPEHKYTHHALRTILSKSY
jgi:hypothetical protein